MDILRMGVEVLCGGVFPPLFLLLPVYYVHAPPSHSRHFPWSTLIVLCVLCLLLWTADFFSGFAWKNFLIFQVGGSSRRAKNTAIFKEQWRLLSPNNISLYPPPPLYDTVCVRTTIELNIS